MARPPRHVRHRTLSEDSTAARSLHAGATSSCRKPPVKQLYSAAPPSSFRGMRYAENETYPKASVFKSNELTIKINSPSVRVVRGQNEDDISLPVFGDHDHIPGSITLDPQNCAAESGQLTITVEGVFEYVSPMSATKAGPTQITPGKHRHVFYQDSVIFPLSVASESRSRPILRSAMAHFRRVTSSERIRPSLKKARSMETAMSISDGHSHSLSSHSSSASSSSCSTSSCQSGRPSVTWSETSDSLYASSSTTPKTFNFNFELPRVMDATNELPPTFSMSNVVSAGVRGRVYSENADVKYRIRALWEALDGSGSRAQLEAPILFQPDTDFHSLDGIRSESWLEVSLQNVDGMSADCAVTMPDPATFSRRSSIPYFVVFTTKPRSRNLAAEIMADATIAVSLVRRVGFDKPNRSLSPSPLSAVIGSEASGKLRSVASSVELGRSGSKTNVHGIWLDTSPAMFSSCNLDSPSLPSASPGASTSPLSPLINGHARFLKRVVKSAPPILSGFRFSRSDPDQDDQKSPISSSLWRPSQKPLPSIPQEPDPETLVSFTPFQGPLRTRPRANTQPAPPRPAVRNLYPSAQLPDPPTKTGRMTTPEVNSGVRITRLTDSRTLHTDVSVGFPKRPKGRAACPGSHPSLESVTALPDGLYKGFIPLQRDWFPSVKWNTLSIEYFLQVSVIFDNSEFKGQVPLRLY